MCEKVLNNGYIETHAHAPLGPSFLVYLVQQEICEPFWFLLRRGCVHGLGSKEGGRISSFFLLSSASSEKEEDEREFDDAFSFPPFGLSRGREDERGTSEREKSAHPQQYPSPLVAIPHVTNTPALSFSKFGADAIKGDAVALPARVRKRRC